MGKSGGAPEYSSATVDTGLWGSSTADKSGATYKPTQWISDTMGTVSNSLNPTLNSMNSTLSSIMSGDYLNDNNFKTYKNQFDKQAQQTYDNSLGSLAKRGLLDSSALAGATNSWGESVQDNLTDLMDNYYNRQVSNYGLLGNNLSNLLNTSNALYNYMTGTTGMAQNQANNVSNYNMQKYQTEQAANNALWSSLANLGGTLGGAAILASDIRLKENVEKISQVGDFNIYKFDYIDGDKNQVGVIAQEMQELCPECVIEGQDGYLKVDYSKLPQEVQDKINEVK